MTRLTIQSLRMNTWCDTYNKTTSNVSFICFAVSVQFDEWTLWDALRMTFHLSFDLDTHTFTVLVTTSVDVIIELQNQVRHAQSHLFQFWQVSYNDVIMMRYFLSTGISPFAKNEWTDTGIMFCIVLTTCNTPVLYRVIANVHDSCPCSGGCTCRKCERDD